MIAFTYNIDFAVACMFWNLAIMSGLRCLDTKHLRWFFVMSFCVYWAVIITGAYIGNIYGLERINR